MEGQRMAASEIDATSVLASMPNPVFVLDASNHFAYLNTAAEMFFQSSQVMLVGTALAALVPEDTTLFSMLARARSQQLSVADQGVELVGPRTGLKLVNVQISPFAERGNAEGHLLVTIQERALAERLRGQSVFHGAARSISAMAALLAHEVKNPLAGIKGAAQLLEADLRPEEADLTRVIVEETDRITALLDRMEGFAGGGNVVLAPVNIHEILDHCLTIASASFGAHLNVSRSYDPSLPRMSGHRDLLIQTFINIIKNAAEVSDKNGKIVIKTSYSRGRRLSAAAPRTQLHVPIQVEIIDNGPGIAEELRDHIFDPFVTGKMGGSGLGLAMVASVVADHGGMVEVDSSAGQTVFRINFPIAHDEAERDKG
jgi:two-component system nitrogen regulation sensor histidine kinase GlnL